MYCLVWAPGPDGDPGTWSIGKGGGCLPCPRDAEKRLPSDIGKFKVHYDEDSRTYTVTYPESYSLMRSGDPTPDEFVDGSAAIRGMGSCRFLSIRDQEHGEMPGTRKLRFKSWDADSRDRIELVLKHCSGNGDKS